MKKTSQKKIKEYYQALIDGHYFWKFYLPDDDEPLYYHIEPIDNFFREIYVYKNKVRIQDYDEYNMNFFMGDATIIEKIEFKELPIELRSYLKKDKFDKELITVVKEKR